MKTGPRGDLGEAEGSCLPQMKGGRRVKGWSPNLRPHGPPAIQVRSIVHLPLRIRKRTQKSNLIKIILAD